MIASGSLRNLIEPIERPIEASQLRPAELSGGRIIVLAVLKKKVARTREFFRRFPFSRRHSEPHHWISKLQSYYSVTAVSATAPALCNGVSVEIGACSCESQLIQQLVKNQDRAVRIGLAPIRSREPISGVIRTRLFGCYPHPTTLTK